MDVDFNNNRMGDIFKSCMSILDRRHYPTIPDFYSEKTVAITGGTGFVGKGVIEKLLRSCPGVKKIILLIRAKRGVSAEERLNELCEMPVFDRLRQIDEHFGVKLFCVECELAEKDLGLSLESRQILSEEVEVFIHSAAGMRFNEDLRTAYNLNTKCTQNIVRLCKKMMNLVAFVHVSTAFSNCDRSDIDERIYRWKVNYKDFERSLRWMSDDALENVAPDVIGGKSNTYVLTKAMAEEAVADEIANLPACIVRPGMIIAAWKEPEPGWIGNLYGPTSLMAAYMKGLCRQIIAEPTINADLVPVDFVINCVIASAMKTAYDAALRKQAERRKSSYAPGTIIESDDSSTDSIVENPCTEDAFEIPIYCMITSKENPLELKFLYDTFLYWNNLNPASPIIPLAMKMYYSKTLYRIKAFLTATTAAYALDFLQFILRRPQKFVKINSRIINVMDAFSFFFTHQFNFNVKNLIKLRSILCESDRREFTTDVSEIDWVEYLRTYNLGVHKFVLEDSEEDFSNAPRKVAIYHGVLRSWNLFTYLIFAILPASCGSPSAIWDASFYHWHMRRGVKRRII